MRLNRRREVNESPLMPIHAVHVKDWKKDRRIRRWWKKAVARRRERVWIEEAMMRDWMKEKTDGCRRENDDDDDDVDLAHARLWGEEELGRGQGDYGLG